MKKIVLVVLAVAFYASTIQAQIVSSKNSRIEKIKVERKNYNRISFGLSTMKVRDTYYDKSNREIFGFDKESITMKGLDINYLRGISLTSKVPLFLEVGGRLTFDTYKEKETDSDTYATYDEKGRMSLLGISVPINVTYKYTFSNGFYLAPYIGMHFRVNVIGKYKYEYEIHPKSGYEKYFSKLADEETYNIFKADDNDDDAFFDSDEDPCKRFQVGGQVGLNIGYKALNLGFGYYFDSPIYKFKSDTSSKYDYKYKCGGVALTLGFNF